MLTPAERDRALRFAMWLRGDQERNEPPVQLSLMEIGDAETPRNTSDLDLDSTVRLGRIQGEKSGPALRLTARPMTAPNRTEHV